VALSQQLGTTRCALFGHRWEVDPGQTIGRRQYGPFHVCHRCKVIDGEPKALANGTRAVRMVIAALYVLIAVAVVNVINTAALGVAAIVLAFLAVSPLLVLPKGGPS
jgi:hypothetical protein